VEELAQSSEVNALLQAQVDALNKHLASYESVKKFAILPRDFTIEADELTPSLKLKRKAIEKKYQAILDGFYGEAVARI